MGNLYDELMKLKELVDMGVLTKDEFNEQKKKLLDSHGGDDKDADEENVNTVCKINAERSLDLSEVLKASKQNESGIAQMLIDLTGASLMDIIGLKAFIEIEKSVPKYYYFGDPYNVVKEMEDANYDLRKYAEHPKNLIQNEHVPKCPTCGSTKLQSLDVLSRGVSVTLWGAGSNKINKTFQCKNCGYTW